MQQQPRFRAAIYAVAITFHAQTRIVPGMLVRAGRKVGGKVIRHLDARRERREAA